MCRNGVTGMTDREAALLWLSSFVKNKEPMTLIPKQLIRLMYNALRECETKTGQWENGHVAGKILRVILTHGRTFSLLRIVRSVVQTCREGALRKYKNRIAEYECGGRGCFYEEAPTPGPERDGHPRE